MLQIDEPEGGLLVSELIAIWLFFTFSFFFFRIFFTYDNAFAIIEKKISILQMYCQGVSLR